MSGLKTNKTRKTFTIFAVAIGLFIAVNVVMWATSYATEDVWPIQHVSSKVDGIDTWDINSRFNNELYKNHLATEKQKVKYHDNEGYSKSDKYVYEIKGVYMTVDRSYITVHYQTRQNKEYESLFGGCELSFEMVFTVFDADGNKIDEFTETTEWRTDMYDDKGYDKQVFHANGGKHRSDFRTPKKPVTVICNELVDRGVITKDFADNTSLEELIQYGYVKVNFTKIRQKIHDIF